MVAQEGRVDVIGVGAQIGGIGLLQGGGVGGDRLLIACAPNHLHQLAVGVAEGEVEQGGDAGGIVGGDIGEALPDLGDQIGVGLQGGGGGLDPVQDLHIGGDVAGVKFLGSVQPEA